MLSIPLMLLTGLLRRKLLAMTGALARTGVIAHSPTLYKRNHKKSKTIAAFAPKSNNYQKILQNRLTLALFHGLQ